MYKSPGGQAFWCFQDLALSKVNDFIQKIRQALLADTLVQQSL